MYNIYTHIYIYILYNHAVLLLNNLVQELQGMQIIQPIQTPQFFFLRVPTIINSNCTNILMTRVCLLYTLTNISTGIICSVHSKLVRFTEHSTQQQNKHSSAHTHAYTHTHTHQLDKRQKAKLLSELPELHIYCCCCCFCC